MENTPDAGIASGQIYHADGSLGINFNYFPDLRLKFLGSGLLRTFYPQDFPKKGVEYTIPLKVPLLNGSSLFVRKTAMEAIGGFDTGFFLYCEEEDLALRMKKKGYSCYLVPEARFIHFEGKSSIRDSGINYLMLREFYISQHYLYRKHYGMMATLIWRISQFFRTFRKFYIHPDYARLGLFILLHPDEKYSLRYAEENRRASRAR
jgi:GT2 family glycosyltransferase